jgi:tetratricopeptide (TPR) repeat protein
MRRIALALALVPIAVLAACASAQKTADQAAATGDWKTAEANYAAVLRDDPNNGEKRARWQNARTRALQGAIDHCNACRTVQDWECAFGEADYLVRMEPGSSDYAALRADVGRQAAWGRLSRTSQALSARDWRGAFAGLAAARAASNDPAVQAEANKLQPPIVSGAVAEAQRLRQAQQYPGALELLSSAAAVDASVRPTLDQTRAEYDRWLDAQYEAQARQGDALLRDRRFAEAAQAYDAAQKIKRGGRAEPLARYARALQAGDAAVQRKDWPAATRSYDEALRTGQDGQAGYARAQLDRVRLRPVAIRVRSALVRPIRPDGAPWDGPAGPGYQRVVGLLANAAMDGRGRQAAAGIDFYDALPHENRPNLVAVLTLPDGRQLATAPQRALRARFDASVVVSTNALDDRPVAVRIVHRDPRGDVEVGTVRLRMADLVQGGEVGLTDRSVVEVKLVAEQTTLRDGTATGFAPVGPAPQPASSPPPRR